MSPLSNSTSAIDRKLIPLSSTSALAHGPGGAPRGGIRCPESQGGSWMKQDHLKARWHWQGEATSLQPMTMQQSIRMKMDGCLGICSG
jgi:hypothetical protein